jgi:hypothetical protein
LGTTVRSTPRRRNGLTLTWLARKYIGNFMYLNDQIVKLMELKALWILTIIPASALKNLKIT